VDTPRRGNVVGKKIKDAEGERWLSFDGRNAGSPLSVFVRGPRGLCIEFEKEAFIQALKDEFGLHEPVAAGAERFLLERAA
jgi:hypothetical protein